jgi:hypothetical protein
MGTSQIWGWRSLIGLSALIATAPANAAEPIYFHKPDVSRENFASDYGHCAELAGGVQAPPPIAAYSPNIYAAAMNGFFNGFFRSREKRHMVENVLRTCMADKGYRRVRASKQMIRELNQLPEKERVDRLFVLAATPVPQGEVMPR